MPTDPPDRLFEGCADGQYLRNRILKAYEAGWWARDAVDSPPLNHGAFGHTPRCTTGGCKP